MKIARLELEDKTVCHAIAQPDGGYTRADGDIFTGLTDSGSGVQESCLRPFSQPIFYVSG